MVRPTKFYRPAVPKEKDIVIRPRLLEKFKRVDSKFVVHVTRASRIHPAVLHSQEIHPLAHRRRLGIDLPVIHPHGDESPCYATTPHEWG